MEGEWNTCGVSELLRTVSLFKVTDKIFVTSEVQNGLNVELKYMWNVYMFIVESNKVFY